MADRVKAVSKQAEPLPGETPAVTPKPLQGAETKPPTQPVLDEAALAPLIQKIVGPQLDELAKATLSKAQSYFDTTNNKFGQQVQARLKDLEANWASMAKAGLTPPSDAEKERVRNQVVLDTLGAGASDSETPATPGVKPGEPLQTQPGEQKPPEGGRPGESLADQLERVANEMQDKAGIDIMQGDQEEETLDWTSLSTLVISLDAAIKAKAKRVAPLTPTNVGLSGGPTNPIAEINNPQELLKMHFDGQAAKK